MTVCIHCAMRALLAGEPVPMAFDETPEQHMERLHPDPYETFRERQELEAEIHKRGLSFERNT